MSRLLYQPLLLGRLKLLLIMGVLPPFVLMQPIPDASAICLDVQPQIWITRQKNYFNNYLGWGEPDDRVPISGLVRLDVIDEARYGSRVLIEIQYVNGTMVKSDYAALNLTDGSFDYNFTLWINPIPDDFPYDVYIVKATYGLYQADWRFSLGPEIPSGINQISVEIPRIMDASDNDIADKVKVWQQVEILIRIKNNEEIPLKDLPFVSVFEIRNSYGQTVYLGWQSGSVISGCSTEFKSSWMAEKEGEYKVRVFAITDLESPRVLSLVNIKEILVTN